jgi:hypothetical protein
MATLSVENAAVTGLTATFNTADASGDVFANDGATVAIIRNSSGANTYTVTIAAPGTYKGRTITAPTATVDTSSVGEVIGPFHPDIHNNTSGQVSLTYSGSPGDAPATDLTVAIVKVDL